MRKLFAALLLLSLVSSASATVSLVDVLARVSPSVGALYAQASDGSLSFNCTVTAVGREGEYLVVVTAFHCVQKDVAFLISFDGRQFYSASVWQIPHDEIDGSKYPRSFGEPQTDMALFLADVGDVVPMVDFGDDQKTPIGTKTVTVSFPLGVTKISYEGLIAGRMNRPGSKNDGYLILQSFGAPGSSGAAVIDVESEKIIAILVSAKQEQVGLPVIFGTPASYRDKLCDVRQPDNSPACARAAAEKDDEKPVE